MDKCRKLLHKIKKCRIPTSFKDYKNGNKQTLTGERLTVSLTIFIINSKPNAINPETVETTLDT